MPCTEVLCKCEAWWRGCARIGGGGVDSGRVGAQAGATQTGRCRRIHLSAPGCLELAAAPTLLSYPGEPGWVGSGQEQSSLQPSGPAHLGAWHSDGLAGGFLVYSGRAELWPQSPQSPETQGPTQVG